MKCGFCIFSLDLYNCRVLSLLFIVFGHLNFCSPSIFVIRNFNVPAPSRLTNIASVDSLNTKFI